MEPTGTSSSESLVALRVQRVLEDPSTDTRILVLCDESGKDLLPIWVGAAEGNAIRLAMDEVVTPRPMTHDLMKNCADHLNLKIHRVVVSDVKNSTYYAAIHLASRGVERTLDARPSDAVALALRVRCPIYVTEDVLKRRSSGNLDAWLTKFETPNSEARNT
jgi:hypothetical protein